MSEEADASQELVALSFGAQGVDEVSELVAVIGLGMCSALISGIVTPSFACRRLFGPALLSRLERAGACGDLLDAIHLATELEDVADIVPQQLPGAVADLEARLFHVLKSFAPPDDAGDKWLIARPSAAPNLKPSV